MHTPARATRTFLRRLLGALLMALLLSACAIQPSVADAPVPSVLLVSLDGFRPGDVDPAATPTLARLAREGVHAAWMNPSYPSLTFPNHYSMVTGLRPDRHGMVHNTMTDATLGRFQTSDRDAVGDGRWWQGEPLWVRAERAGLRTATLFWPGSEAPIQGMQPQRWRPFDATLSPAARVDIVLGWLGEPLATRPRLATLYFDGNDVASHDHGPDSPQAEASRRELDAALARLLDGLAARGMSDRVDLVVVSDHGMATVAPGHVVLVEDMVAAEDARAITTGQSVGFQPLPGREMAAERALLGAHQRYDCWRREELPERWDYGRHPRVPAIVCQMHEGWDALTRSAKERRPPGQARGSHGYDPALPSMRALFIAHGPSFRRGVSLPAFDNVDVYSLLAHLLGIQPAEGDGSLHALRAALRAPPAPAGRGD
jgi:predicted AlkP superfamily pyrophosphatase or phosphodiesterase